MVLPRAVYGFDDAKFKGLQKDAAGDLEICLQGTLAILAQALKPAQANKCSHVSNAAKLSLQAHGPAEIISACPSLIVCLHICDQYNILVAVLAA